LVDFSAKNHRGVSNLAVESFLKLMFGAMLHNFWFCALLFWVSLLLLGGLK